MYSLQIAHLGEPEGFPPVRMGAHRLETQSTTLPGDRVLIVAAPIFSQAD